MGNNLATGFFCKKPFPNKDRMLHVLMTNNHLLNEELIYKNNVIISLSIKNEEVIRKFNLNNRIKYTNKVYDTTIIEIKEKDNINKFLELDEKVIDDIINNKNSNKNYIDKTIYIIQYPDGELAVSYGILSKII